MIADNQASNLSAEMNSAEIEDVLIQALNRSAYGITLSDARREDSPLVYVNDNFATLTGYSRDDVIGKNCRFLQGEDTDPEAVAMIREAIRCGQATSCLLLNYRRDGSRFWNRFQLSPVRDKGGDVVAFLGIQSDVTDHLESRDREAEQQRLAILGRRTGEFVHELNNALLPIVLHAEAIGDYLDPENEVAQTHLQHLQASARTAGHLAQNALGTTRRSSYNKVSADVIRLLNEAIDFASGQLPPLVRLRRSKLDRPLFDQTFTAAIDPIELQQVISNLVINAVHALDGIGEIDIAIRVVGPGTDDQLAEMNGVEPYVEVVVGDDGCGMDAETRSRIFEPYFTTKPLGVGTGLGLSTTFGIVERWGGRVDVESHPGLGTFFTIRIPGNLTSQKTGKNDNG